MGGDGDQRGCELPARLYAAVTSIYRRWAEEMPFEDPGAELDTRPLPQGLRQGTVPAPRPPLWDGWVYELLHRLCWRGRDRLPELLDELAAADPEGYGAVYGVWITLLDLRLEWYGAASRLAELGWYVDLALHWHESEDGPYMPWLLGARSSPAGDPKRVGALATGARRGGLTRDRAGRLAAALGAIEASLSATSDDVETLASVDAEGDCWDDLVELRQLLNRVEFRMTQVMARFLEAEPILQECIAARWGENVTSEQEAVHDD